MPMFRLKQPVEAQQWKGPTDCEELKAMAGYWIGFDATGTLMVTTVAPYLAPIAIGDWIIKRGPCDFIVYTNDQFTVLYEKESP